MVTAMPDDRASHEPFLARILLVLGGQAVFASLAHAITEAAPAFEVTVVFGLLLALGLELQARRAIVR
jgi:hypothetical protein